LLLLKEHSLVELAINLAVLLPNRHCLVLRTEMNRVTLNRGAHIDLGPRELTFVPRVPSMTYLTRAAQRGDLANHFERCFAARVCPSWQKAFIQDVGPAGIGCADGVTQQGLVRRLVQRRQCFTLRRRIHLRRLSCLLPSFRVPLAAHKAHNVAPSLSLVKPLKPVHSRVANLALALGLQASNNLFWHIESGLRLKFLDFVRAVGDDHMICLALPRFFSFIVCEIQHCLR